MLFTNQLYFDLGKFSLRKDFQQYFVPKKNHCPRIREALLSHLRCPFTHCLRDGPLRAPLEEKMSVLRHWK